MNPYEDDLHDLSVMEYINLTIAASRKLISGHVMPPSTLELEAKLERGRSVKGRGFQTGINTYTTL